MGGVLEASRREFGGTMPRYSGFASFPFPPRSSASPNRTTERDGQEMAKERRGHLEASSEAEGATGLEVGQLPLGVIRLVVVCPGSGELDDAPPMAVETTAALARLGDPVELLRAQSRDELIEFGKDPSVDPFFLRSS